MSIVNLSHVIDNSHQLINRVLHGNMMIIRDDFGKVQSRGHFDPVIEFLLAEFAVGKALDLQDYDLGQPIEIQFALAFLKR